MKSTPSSRRPTKARLRTALYGIALTAAFWVATAPVSAAIARGFGPLLHFSDDAGWCWFEDDRVIVQKDNLIIGTVAAGRKNPARRGDIEAVIYNLKTRQATAVELHDRLQLDDHNSPVFLVRPDNRLLVLYAKHNPENCFYYRISEPNNPAVWGVEQRFVPSAKSRITYSNTHRLRAENNRIYNFFRGLDGLHKTSYAFSDDGGEKWITGRVIFDFPAATGARLHRPYVRYASNGRDTIHLFYTEAHPNEFDTSVYHLFYRKGWLHRSDGERIAQLAETTIRPELGTRIFQADSNNVAWPMDIELDQSGRPVLVYSVRFGSPRGVTQSRGEDIRYRYARWDGREWHDYPLAFAGQKLCAGQDDYSGLAAIHPHDCRVVFISTNADPGTGEPLISRADQKRHYEIFRGTTVDAGRTWMWKAMTEDSTADNLRPIVPKWKRGKTILVWLRGSYPAYTDYSQEAVGLIW